MSSKFTLIAVNAIFGLGLIAWPLLAIGWVFLYDVPTCSTLDELSRITYGLSICLYPVCYLFGLIISFVLYKKRKPFYLIALAGAIPLLSVFGGIFSLWLVCVYVGCIKC